MFSALHARKPIYGWIPDLPDQRDFLYALTISPLGTLPDHVDLRHRCSPIDNQGELGSCTAHALVGNLEFLKKNPKRGHGVALAFSRLFLYYNERAIRHTERTDSGASLRDGIKTLVKAGDCLEKTWPYMTEAFADRPTHRAYAQAEHYLITRYYRMVTLQEMKHTLSLGYPFVFGFAVYESFESPAVTNTGKVELPTATERLIGGHAVMAVGFDDVRERFSIRNSWGDHWGDHGYFTLPYAYLENPSLASDFWTIRDME